MDKEHFIKYIENDRDCNIELLDIAVITGLHRAKNDRIDKKKVFLLAAACLFIFAMCFSVNLELFKITADEYFRNLYSIMPGTADVLDFYINDITTKIMIFLGGV